MGGDEREGLRQDGVFRRIASGALLGGLGFVSAALATFWATPQVVGGLGMEQYAVLGLLVGVQGGLLMVLSNPGQIAGLVVLAGPDDDGLHRRSRALSAWTLLAAVLAWAVGWALSLSFVAELLWKDEMLQHAWSAATPWAGLGWACQLIAQALWAGQRARLRAAQAEAQQALVSVLYVLAAPWAIYQAAGLEGVVEAQATVWVLAVVLGLLWERRTDGRLTLWPKDDPETFSQIRHLAFWSVIALLGSAVLLYADRLYSLKASPRELAAWSVATALSLRVAAGLGILGPLLLPSLSTVREDPERAARLESLYLRLTGLPALAFFIPLSAGGAALLGAWVAPEVEERARPWIQLLAISGFAFCLNGAYSTILTGIGKVRANAFISLGSAVIGVTAGAIALATGHPGAAWMGVAGQGLSMLWRIAELHEGRLRVGLRWLPWALAATVPLAILPRTAFPFWFGGGLARVLACFGFAGLLCFGAALAVDALLAARRQEDSVFSQLKRLTSRGR
jgi:O-antigen/teichoic acid export membrane protein